MSIADKFTQDEWAKVVAAPMVWGIAVTAVAGELRSVRTEPERVEDAWDRLMAA